MKAVILIRREPHYRREAIADGLKRLGYEIVFDRLGALQPESRDDLLVVWNLKAGMDESAAMIWESRGGTVVVMENGYLAKQEKTYYAISVHGHNGSGWFPFTPDDNEDRYLPLGFGMPEKWRNDGDYALICGQRGIGSSMMRSPADWTSKTIARLRHLSVKIRAHPGNFAATVPLDDDLSRASVCVIWSSSCGVYALTKGIPVYYGAPHWICEDIASPVAGTLSEPWPPRPMDHLHTSLNRMAHGQWSVAEIALGTPFARMMDLNWGNEAWK